MDFMALISTSRQFLRTREAIRFAPSIPGLIRHVEATRALQRVFVPNGANGISGAAFVLWRLVLIAVSDTQLLLDETARLLRF